MKFQLIVISAISLTACSTASVYDFIAVNTEPDCNIYGNAEDRNRCKKEANIPYEQYEKERQKAKSK